MTTETHSEIDVVPPQVKVIRHVRQVYACRHCERHELQTPIVTAPMPKPLYPGSLASPSAMAYVMCQKYVDSMPLYRQEQQFARLGYALLRQTMANGMIYGAERWLKPVVIYDYRRTRGGKHPRDFLAGFNGYLHVDGYAGYHKVKDVTLVGCWAHALAYCNQLFAIERELKEATPEERHKARAERSRPVLDAYYAWLRQQKSRTMPKNLLDKAIAYSLNQWEKLSASLKDGILEIDNNRSERSIKLFVIGRKNGLFANTPRGKGVVTC